MFNTISSYFYRVKQAIRNVDALRSPFKRPLDEVSDDEEMVTRQPYKPVRKKLCPSSDEPMPHITKSFTHHLEPTLHLGAMKPPPLSTIKEEEASNLEDIKFLKTKKAVDLRKTTIRRPLVTPSSSVTPQKWDVAPKNTATTVQPQQSTSSRQAQHQGEGGRKILKINRSSSSWPRNCLRKSNYNAGNKKPLPIASARWRPPNMSESGFRIAEKRQYQQLLEQCTSSRSPLSSHQSICQISSGSSASSSPVPTTHGVSWSRSLSSVQSGAESENTSPTSPMTDRLSKCSDTVSVDVGSKEDFASEQLLKEECPGRKKCISIPVIDLCHSDSESGESDESIEESDNDAVEIVDEFPNGSRKTSLLKDLYDRKWMKGMEHSSFGHKTCTVNKDDEESILERRRNLMQSLQDRVRERLTQLDLIPTSKDEWRPLSSITKPSFAPLSPEMEDEIEDALRPFPKSEILNHKFNISVTRRDIATLDGLNWLNDEIVNFYMNMIMERSMNNKMLPRVYVFSTFFYPKLEKSGQQSVSRWTKKVDIFTYDILLVPVHLGVHWCMATVDFKKRCIAYYDSMLGNNDTCLELLLAYLKAEHLDKKKTPYTATAWRLENMKNIPEQMNGSDCGVFSCQFAEYNSRRAPLNFNQEDMDYFRRRMVYEIIKGELLQ